MENNKDKVCFRVSDEHYAKVKALPRSFNLSEKLRIALADILQKHDTNKK